MSSGSLRVAHGSSGAKPEGFSGVNFYSAEWSCVGMSFALPSPVALASLVAQPSAARFTLTNTNTYAW